MSNYDNFKTTDPTWLDDDKYCVICGDSHTRNGSVCGKQDCRDTDNN